MYISYIYLPPRLTRGPGRCRGHCLNSFTKYQPDKRSPFYYKSIPRVKKITKIIPN